jgi:ABC-type branched-subunit amino acid transport system substrate-binding protein
MFRKIFLYSAILPVVLLGCNEPGPQKERRDRETSTYTIGVNLPLTGNGSYFAEETRKGLDLGFGFINEGSARMKLNVIYEDNKLNPRDAVTITRKFLDVDKVDLLISGYTPIIQAIIDLVDRNGIPMLVTLSSTENIAAPYRWVFRDFELESNNMPLLASYARSVMGLTRGSWLVVNDDMGADAVRFFSDSFIQQGGIMMKGEVFEATDTDLRNKINKVMVDEPEFVIVIGRGSAMINALRQIRERDGDLPLFCNNTVDNEQIWDALGNQSDHIWFPRPFSDRSGEAWIKTNERFREKHDRDMNWLNIYGVTMANYIIKGLKHSAGDRDSLRQFLEELDVQTIRGRLVMNGNSDVVGQNEIYTRKDGKSIPVN